MKQTLNRDELERHLLVVACASSAGIHGALIPDHLQEGVGPGGGFLAATLLLAGAVLWLSRSASPSALGATALLLAGLLISYALATTTGVPLLHPESEPVDGLALATKAIEAAGLLTALHLLRVRPAGVLVLPRHEGSLT